MDERGIFDLGMKSRLNPNQLGDVLKAYGQGDSTLDKYKSETERMRAEAYRKQVEGHGAATISEEPPDQETPDGYTWVRTERGWAMKKAAGMSGYPAGSKPVSMNGVEYMQGPDGTLYPTKQPSAGAAIANKLGGGTPAPVASSNEVTRYTADGRAAVLAFPLDQSPDGRKARPRRRGGVHRRQEGDAGRPQAHACVAGRFRQGRSRAAARRSPARKRRRSR